MCNEGGGGGGAVQLVSLCGTVFVADYINASGGAGFGGGGGVRSADCADGYGGGAGGTVWFQGKVRIGAPDGRAPLVQLGGGGGGSGSCRQADGALVAGGMGVVARVPQNPKPQPAGAVCANDRVGGIGGIGGIGANGRTPPGAGGQPMPRDMPELARCGGGGGAPGRMVLQDVGLNCDDLPAATDGVCVPAVSVERF